MAESSVKVSQWLPSAGVCLTRLEICDQTGHRSQHNENAGTDVEFSLEMTLHVAYRSM